MTLRWSTDKPAVSGVYLNGWHPPCQPWEWQVVLVDSGGKISTRMMDVERCELDDIPSTILGPLWAGPLKIGGPE